MRRPYNIAHQGASGLAPSNTLAAFERAVAEGADWIEIDVVTTVDGVVVVSHDTTVDRYTNGHGAIIEMSLAQVKALDAGARFGPQFAGQRIPTLEETVLWARQQPIRLCIEIKGDSVREYRRTAVGTVDLLQRLDYIRPAVITSFSPECVQAVKVMEPCLSIALDPDKQDGTYTPWELCQQVLRCGANFMLHNYRALAPEILDEAREHGFSVWAWTVNDPTEMRRVAALRPDGIMTDRPDLLRQVLAEGA